MTDLNIARIGSLEDSDDPSNAGRISYNSWRYGDEASLYSIAEDSREALSSRGTASASRNSSHATYTNPPPSTLLKQGEDEIEPIEVQWKTDEDMEVEQNNQRGDMVPMPSRDPDDEEPSVDEELGTRHNTRRSLHLVCLLAGAVVAIVLSLTFSLRDRSSEPITRVSGGIEDGEFQSDTPVDSAPTMAPTYTQSVDDFVVNAILSCEHTSAVRLESSWPQLEVLETIKMHVSSLVSVRDDGFLEFDPMVGKDYVLELFAMLMLFFDTTGELWTVNTDWYSEKDVCEWYNQATDHCIERVPGGAAVRKIKLSSNNLQGPLPSELCCLPTLEEVELDNNGLKGTEPACLDRLRVIDLVNNEFDQVATKSAEDP